MNIPLLSRPCCVQPLTNNVRDPQMVVDMIRVPPVRRRVIQILADRFGRYIAASDIKDLVYGDARDGGPINASRRKQPDMFVERAPEPKQEAMEL